MSKIEWTDAVWNPTTGCEKVRRCPTCRTRKAYAMNNRKGIGSHQSAAMMKDEWLTPPDIIKVLGPFDLDPCAPIVRPWPTATRHLTIEDDGLRHHWEGRVWCNPPYGQQTAAWLSRMAKHSNGIALVFARTETKMFFDHVWQSATGLLFIEGRLHFYHSNGEKAKGNSGAPSVLVAYSHSDSTILRASGIKGQYIQLKQ